MKKFMQYRWWFLFALIILLFIVKKDQWFHQDTVAVTGKRGK
jgi:hypothetical protein